MPGQETRRQILTLEEKWDNAVPEKQKQAGAGGWFWCGVEEVKGEV